MMIPWEDFTGEDGNDYGDRDDDDGGDDDGDGGDDDGDGGDYDGDGGDDWWRWRMLVMIMVILWWQLSCDEIYLKMKVFLWWKSW